MNRKLKFKPDPTEIKVEKFLKVVWKEIKLDTKNMFNWLLFYKPHGIADKMLHCIEVFVFWAILTTLYIKW